MQKTHHCPTLPMALFLLLSAKLAIAADFDGNRDNWGDGKDHIVLVKINTVDEKPEPNTRGKRLTYTATVAFDVDGSLAGKQIAITGLVGVELNSLWDAALLAKNDIALLHLKSTAIPDKFDCQPSMTLPIGIDTSLAIPPEQVAQLQAALGELKSNYPPKGPNATKSLEPALHDQNYYKWSLAATALAFQQTKESAKALHQQVYTDLSKNQFIWINYLFDNVVTVDAPTPQERLNDYHTFLTRHTTFPLHF